MDSIALFGIPSFSQFKWNVWCGLFTHHHTIYYHPCLVRLSQVCRVNTILCNKLWLRVACSAADWISRITYHTGFYSEILSKVEYQGHPGAINGFGFNTLIHTEDWWGSSLLYHAQPPDHGPILGSPRRTGPGQGSQGGERGDVHRSHGQEGPWNRTDPCSLVVGWSILAVVIVWLCCSFVLYNFVDDRRWFHRLNHIVVVSDLQVQSFFNIQGCFNPSYCLNCRDGY